MSTAHMFFNQKLKTRMLSLLETDVRVTEDLQTLKRKIANKILDMVWVLGPDTLTQKK